jgi:hypothetical protein
MSCFPSILIRGLGACIHVVSRHACVAPKLVQVQQSHGSPNPINLRIAATPSKSAPAPTGGGMTTEVASMTRVSSPQGQSPAGVKKTLAFPTTDAREASADRSPRGRHPSGHASRAMKTVLYCRVSTVDQTLDHQRTHAHQNGFKPDLVLADHGVSGVSTHLCERPEGRRLFDILREGGTLVVRWVDRLGRNYQDAGTFRLPALRPGSAAIVHVPIPCLR